MLGVRVRVRVDVGARRVDGDAVLDVMRALDGTCNVDVDADVDADVDVDAVVAVAMPCFVGVAPVANIAVSVCVLCDVM